MLGGFWRKRYKLNKCLGFKIGKDVDRIEISFFLTGLFFKMIKDAGLGFLWIFFFRCFNLIIKLVTARVIPGCSAEELHINFQQSRFEKALSSRS